MPVVFLVLNLVVNFWIPEADSSKYSFLQSKDKETEGEKKKKKPSLLESYVRGIKECIDPTIGMQAFPPCRQVYVIVRVLTVAPTLRSCFQVWSSFWSSCFSSTRFAWSSRKSLPSSFSTTTRTLPGSSAPTRWVVSSVLAKPSFVHFCFVRLLGRRCRAHTLLAKQIGSGVYALVKDTFTPAMNMVFASTGVLILAVSWWPALAQASVIPFLSPKDEWLLWVLLGMDLLLPPCPESLC